MPEVFAETYHALGERLASHLDLIRIDPTYRVHFHDGSTLDLSSNLESMRSQLEAMEPGSFDAFLQFISEGYRHYTLSLKHFVGRNFTSLTEYFSLNKLPLLFQLLLLPLQLL
jgi:phytoene dehydrogenase-like protein